YHRHEIAGTSVVIAIQIDTYRYGRPLSSLQHAWLDTTVWLFGPYDDGFAGSQLSAGLGLEYGGVITASTTIFHEIVKLMGVVEVIPLAFDAIVVGACVMLRRSRAIRLTTAPACEGTSFHRTVGHTCPELHTSIGAGHPVPLTFSSCLIGMAGSASQVDVT